MFKEIENKCGVRAIDDDEDGSDRDWEEWENEDRGEKGERESPGEYELGELGGEDEELNDTADTQSVLAEGVEVVEKTHTPRERSVSVSSQRKRSGEGKSFFILVFIKAAVIIIGFKCRRQTYSHTKDGKDPRRT